MNTAHKLYETYTNSTHSKVIFDTAHEIKKYFKNVRKKEPGDEIGEELLYLLGGKKETFEWVLFLIIIYLNGEEYGVFFTALSKQLDMMNVKQCKRTNLILKEILPKINDVYIEYCNELIVDLEKAIDEKLLKSELAPELKHSNKLKCDICSNDLDSDEGYLLSPKKVLCNAKYWDFFWEKETKMGSDLRLTHVR